MWMICLMYIFSCLQCAFCEKNKKCMTFSESDVLHKTCEGQEWKYKQCVGEQFAK